MRTQEMLKSHPNPFPEQSLLAEAIAACADCAQSCAMCADACIAEGEIARLRRCIRLNLDCSDVAHATACLLMRQFEPNGEVLRAQVAACSFAARICGEECRSHSERHEHCKHCADACRACEKACAELLKTLPASNVR